MAVVGDAVVRVRALKDSLRRSLNDEFRATEGDADNAGERLGSRYGNAAGIAGSRSFIEGLDMSPAGDHADEEGARSGSRFSDRFAEKLRGLNERAFGGFGRDNEQSMGESGDGGGSSFMDRFAAKLGSIKDAIPHGFGRDRMGEEGDEGGRSFIGRLMDRMKGVDDVLSEAGDAGGRAFSNKISSYDFDMPSIGGLGAKMIALVPLVGVLGGALAALVGAATAMASAFAFAAGAASILATALAGAALGAITGVLALKDVGSAVKAMANAQANAAKENLANQKAQRAAAKAVEQSERALQKAHEGVANAERALADAQKSLTRTRREGARDQARAARDVQNAEEDLAKAQREARTAQEGLTKAREDAKEKLEDLQMQERGAVIGEEEATLRLKEAREAYTKSLNDSSASANDKEQARIDLENAELALDQAKDNREDVTKQTEAANKAGIEGSTEVVDAKQKIADANANVADSEQSLKDARQKQADTAVDVADRIAAAQERVANAQRGVVDANQAVADAASNLADAQERLADAGNATSASQQKLNEILKHMSPAARDFAKYIYSLRGELDKLKAAAGENLFGPLTIAVKNIVGGFLPTLRHALSVTGGGLGEFGVVLSEAFTGADFKKNFTDIADGLSRVDPRTQTSAFGTFGKIIGNVLRGFTGLANAAMPTLIRFLNYVQELTGSFAHKFEGTENMIKMTDLIGRMGSEAAKIGHIFGAVFGSIGNIFKAALPTGQALNSSLLATVQHFQKWTGSPAGQKRMTEFFQRTAILAKEVGRFVVALVKEFLKLGEDKGKGENGGIFKTFKTAREFLPTLREAIENFTEKTAPKAIKAIGDIFKILKRISDSPVLDVIATGIGAVATGLQIVSKILDVPVLGKMIGYTAGFVILAAVLSKIFKMFGGKALVKTLKIIRADDADLPKNKKMPAPLRFGRGVAGRTDQRVSPLPDGSEMREGGTIANAAGRGVRSGAKAAGRGARRATRAAGRGIGSAFSRARGGSGSGGSDLDDALANGDITQDEYDEEMGRRSGGGGGGARRPNILRRARNRVSGGGGGGQRGSASKKILIGGAAAGAIGLALAPVIAGGHIPGLDKAAQMAGDLLNNGMAHTAMAGVGLLMPGVGKKMNALLNGPAGPLIQDAGSKASSLMGDKLQSGISSAASKVGEKVVGKLGPLMSGLGGPAGIASKAMRGVGLAVRFAMGPVGLIITGIALLALGLIYAYKHSETFRKIVDGAMKGIGKAFKAMWTIVGEIFKFLKDHIQIVLLAFGPLGIAISAIVTVFKNWDKIKKIVGDVVDAVVGFFKDLPGRIVGFVTGLGTSLGSWFTTAGGKAKDAVSGAITSVVNFFRDLPGRIGAYAKGWYDKAAELGGKIASGIKDKAGDGFTAVVNFVRDLPGRIAGQAEGVVKKVAGVGSSIGTAIKNAAGSAIGGIVDYITNLPGNFVAGVKKIGGKLGSVGKSIGTAIKDGITTSFGVLVDLIKAPINFLLDGVRGMLQKVGSIRIQVPKWVPKIGGSGWSFPDLSGSIPHLALGATVNPKPGGTLALLAEAGKSETVVDTGLINARLRSSLAGDADIRGELRQQTALLREIARRAGFNIENFTLQAAPEERVAQAVPRVLRDLSYTLGT